MKLQHLVLATLATVLAAGCSPKNPPSGYREPNAAPDTSLTSGNTGKGDVNGDTNGLPVRDPAAGWSQNTSGNPNDIPEGAKLAVIHFGFDKYTVESGERAKLDAIAAAVKGKHVAAWGYSDYHGTEDYNLGLSDKRANSVKKYLGKIGGGDADVHAYGEQFAKQSGDKSAVADDRKVIVVDLDYAGGK